MLGHLLTNKLPSSRLSRIILVILLLTIFVTPPKAYAATQPDLGATATFSVLGSSAVTNTGTTTVSGDLGVSPGTSITNDGVLTIGGATHNNDATAIQAHTDAGAVDLNLLSQGSTGSIGPALDGLNLVPGVYDIGAGRLNGGVLTLNGAGVYIFRASSDFVSSGSVSLTNGARACDVYWDVQTQATINGTSFAGSIFAGSGVTFGSGVSLDGRAIVFGGTGPVTMIGDTISGPSCASTGSGSSSTTSILTNNTTSAPPVAVCPTISTAYKQVSIIESRRIDADSIFVSWGPYTGGVSQFNIQYGPTGNWLYNTSVTGFSTTINSLPLNQPIWVRIAPKSECTIGSYGPAILIGGPGLPNAGLAPLRVSLTWLVSTGITAGVSVFVLRSLRKHRSSSQA